jgi:transcriptional regulator with XRE-family HTH domain
MNVLAERLKNSRISKGLTQMDLGRKVHIAKMAIEDFETGKRIPDYQQMERLSKVLNVTQSYLVGKVENPNEISELNRDDYYICCCGCRGKEPLTDEQLETLHLELSDRAAFHEWSEKEAPNG